MVFNPYKKLVANCYADADFVGLRGHENTQNSICARSRTGFVVTFENGPLLWMSKLHTDISISNLHSNYMTFIIMLDH